LEFDGGISELHHGDEDILTLSIKPLIKAQLAVGMTWKNGFADHPQLIPSCLVALTLAATRLFSSGVVSNPIHRNIYIALRECIKACSDRKAAAKKDGKPFEIFSLHAL
jgi:hypothetical protein